MIEIPFLHDVVVLFGVALLVIVLSNRLRVPPVIGFLITGMIVGPHGLALIDDVHTVEVFAELGVVFLLFIVGLELSPSRIKKLGRVLLVGGGIQVGATIVLATGISLAFGFAPGMSVYFSFLAALSSTAIVLKVYSERRELEAPQGSVAMGILIFQDLLIVPLLLVVPALAGAGGSSAMDFVVRFGGGLLAVGLVFVVARTLLPRVLDAIVGTRIRELFVLGALLACLGGALITETIGFSLVLGGFLAGVMIAETDYRYQVLAETASFRDVFNSMFFISVGMLIQLDFAAANATTILGVSALVIVMKALVVVGAVKVLGYGWRTRILAGLGLAQMSEFAFVLIQVGASHGLLEGALYQVAIASVVVTMVTTPLLIQAGPRLADRFKALAGDEGTEHLPAHPKVSIVGFGLNGRELARALKSASIPYAVAELNGNTVRQAKGEGEPIVYGDSTRLEILEKIGIEEAEVGVFAISDRSALMKSVQLARTLNPELFIVARGRQLSESEELTACGADVVVTEELEASVKTLALTLTHLHLAEGTIREEVRRARADAYKELRDLPTALPEAVVRALETATTGTFVLRDAHIAAASTVLELDLRKQSGASILAVCRESASIVNPTPDMALQAGDVLVLVGSHEEIERAHTVLESKPGDGA